MVRVRAIVVRTIQRDRNSSAAIQTPTSDIALLLRMFGICRSDEADVMAATCRRRSRLRRWWLAIQQHRDLAEWSGIQRHVQWWARRSHRGSDSDCGTGGSGTRTQSRCLPMSLQIAGSSRAIRSSPAHWNSRAQRLPRPATVLLGCFVLQEFPDQLRSAKRSMFSSGSRRITC